MKVTLARGSGFCFGVRDAVQMAHESAADFGKVYMLGDIVHNEHVVNHLDESGVVVVEAGVPSPLISSSIQQSLGFSAQAPVASSLLGII